MTPQRYASNYIYILDAPTSSAENVIIINVIHAIDGVNSPNHLLQPLHRRQRC